MLPVVRGQSRPVPRTDVADPLVEFDRITRDLTEWATSWAWPWSDGDGIRTALADLEETDDAFIVEVDLPGVSKGDVEVTLDGRRLEVNAARRERERVGILRHRTRHVGSYHHEVVLPDEVDPERVEAHLHDGVLSLRLPKTASSRRRRIQVA